MWQYNYSVQNNELYHMGKLGMKWGVRHDPVKTYAKAKKKMDKLNSKVSDNKSRYLKAETRANSGVAAKYKEAQSKADVIRFKADKARIKAQQKPKGWYADYTKADKIQSKADKYQRKADRYKTRAMRRIRVAELSKAEYVKSMYKADKWCKAMESAFRGMDMESLNQQAIERGKRYFEKVA